MSLILASPAALNQPGKPPSNAKSRSDEQGFNNPDSFGEVLSRSLAPAGEITEKTAAKVAAPAPARRQAGDPKTEPADLLNAMALSFVPPERRVAKAMPSDGAVAAPDTTVVAAATAPLMGLPVSLVLPIDKSMATTEVKEVNTLAGAQTVLAPALAPASQKGAGPAMLQARLSPVNASSDLQLDPGKIAAQASVPNTVASDPSPKRDDRATNKPGDISAASADLKTAATPAAEPAAMPTAMPIAIPTAIPAATHGTAKVVAGVATPSAETVAMVISGSQAHAAEPLSASAALPINPVLAAAQAGPATLPARLSPVSDSSALQLDPGKITAQASVPNTGAPDQSSKRDDRAAHKPGDISAASADLKPAAMPTAMPTAIPTATPAATHGTAKVAASAATPSAETTAMTMTMAISGSQVPAAEPLSASAALPINPVMAAALSPAGVASSNTPAAVSTPSLSQEVGSSEWGKALGQQVVQMGKAGHQVAELQLNPPGLGPLKVTLSMHDNQIQALFVSAHSSVRAAVEAALPQLRATLADSGISLGNTSVSAGSQQQQTAFAHSQNGQPDQRSFRSNSRVDMAALSARAVTEPLRQSNGITVDTYA